VTEETLTIGEVAAKAGVNVQTLRYYERRGLLKAPFRRETGHRQYPSDAVAFIRSIKHAQSLGFTLAEIEGLVATSERRPSRASEVLAASAARKIEEVDGRIAELQAARSRLQAVIDQRCDSLTHCTCGNDCALDATTPQPSEIVPQTSANLATRHRLALLAPATILACLVCFLPAILVGVVGVAAFSSLPLADAGRDLPLAAGAAALGVASGLAFASFRANRHPVAAC
jgi:DNA-binding transcriptional MerR regulator